MTREAQGPTAGRNLIDGTPVPRAASDEPTHWLVTPLTVRQLWIGSIVVLALTVLGDLFVTHHTSFGVDGTFGFGAWFGFGACVALVLGSKLVGKVLKRPDTYYGAEGPAGDRHGE
ncbi:MAG: hypothetical protein AAGJ70_12765 [Pseudomonadota bacterium]